MTFMHKLSKRLALNAITLLIFAVCSLTMYACAAEPIASTGGGSTTTPVASVALAPPTLNLQVGQTGQLAATLKNAAGSVLSGRTITWSSTAQATVSSSGLVTAVSPGAATITATSEGISATASAVIVPVPVASVSVSPGGVSLTAGQTSQLAATTKDAGGNTLSGRVVSWSTGDASIATVSTTGLVSAVAQGTTTITATSEGKSGSASVTVTSVPATVASVSVTPGTLNLTAGQTGQLTATPRDASGNALSGRTITWTSSNTSAATVSSSGLVSAVAQGTATITATADGKSGTSNVTVAAAPAPVATVAVSPTSLNLTVGQTGQLTATTKDASGNTLTGRTVTWTSSATGVATVSSSGLVTAAGAGSATITATSEGKSNTASVTVTLAPVATVTVSPSSVTQVVGATAQLTATMKDASGNTLTGRGVTWSSNNTAVATVDGSGRVSLVSAGNATITATSEGKSGTASVTATTPSPTAGEPVYSASNPDHKLHLEETWANLTSIANLFTSPRSDGGPHWVQEGGTTLLHRYLGTTGDGFGSVRYVTIDFTENPPLPPDSHCSCYHWYMGTGDDLSAGSDWVRGFNSGTWLNNPVKAAVVYEWAMRERGTNWYEGKHVDIGAGEANGVGRWLFDHFFDPLGIGGDFACGDALCKLYYSNNGNTARFPNMPQNSSAVAPAIHRSQSAELPGAAGSSFVIYKQNLNWGLSAGQFVWSPKGGDPGPTNADTRGNNVSMWNAGWLYYKLQITREPATTPYAYGTGRLEMWIGPTPGSLVKVLEYKGDPGELAQGKVWVAPSASTGWTDTVHWFQPTARVYKGGAIVDLGTVRIWSHSRQ